MAKRPQKAATTKQKETKQMKASPENEESPLIVISSISTSAESAEDISRSVYYQPVQPTTGQHQTAQDGAERD